MSERKFSFLTSYLVGQKFHICLQNGLLFLALQKRSKVILIGSSTDIEGWDYAEAPVSLSLSSGVVALAVGV